MLHYDNIHLTRNLKLNVTYLTLFNFALSSTAAVSSMTFCQTVLLFKSNFYRYRCKFSFRPLSLYVLSQNITWNEKYIHEHKL